MFILENSKLKITVKKEGAELCNITSTKNGKEFMWDADPNIWKGYAPNLFPIIGALKNGTYHYNHASYKMNKHGFVRGNTDIVLHEQTSTSLTFKLSSNKSLYKIYPFRFEFFITYLLKDNSIDISYTVKNCDNKTMYFSIGGHPAFKCPIYKDENYSDYSLEFETIENAQTHLINMESGLISSDTKPVFNSTNKINLSYDLFNNDALVFKDLVSKKVTLKSKTYGNILSVSFNDFPYLGIWAKPNANYVCIEPWLGIADHENTNQDLKTKEGILSLDTNASFKSQYTIKIDDNHLV